jgi:hypothetical protein
METNNSELNAALQFGADPSLTTHPAWDRLSWGVNILQDMAAKLVRYKSLTPKQAAFAIKLHKESLQKMKWADERSEERAQRVAAGIRAPLGRTEVTGVILKQKFVATKFGDSIKCLIQLPDGAKVWGTKPAAASTENGKQVTFVATFTPSEDDPSFGFYSRPHDWREAA